MHSGTCIFAPMRRCCLFFAVCLLLSCKSINEVNGLPSGNFFTSPSLRQTLFQSADASFKTASVIITDTALHIRPSLVNTSVLLPLNALPKAGLRLQQKNIDLDIFTIPFKIRPSVAGFPEQLNPNFSAALYLGRRHNSYRIARNGMGVSKIYSAGFGYGFFTGLGAVTMNPFVTGNSINYEYDGMVLMGGFAAIYDAKKFNIGVSVGIDHLVDKNQNAWIYQQKPWFGVLFGIDIN